MRSIGIFRCKDDKTFFPKFLRTCISNVVVCRVQARDDGRRVSYRQRDSRSAKGGNEMNIFLLIGKDPNDQENPEKTWIIVAEREIDARKLLPGHFEVYEVEVRTGDLGGMPGVVGWMGEPQDI